MLAKLPKKSEPNIKWKEVKDEKGEFILDGDIKKTITVNGKTLTVRIGGRYDANGNLNTTIETFYP